MQRNLLRPFTLLITLLLGAATAAAAATGSFDRTLKVAGAVDLEVSTGSGTITVRTGDASTVRVHATIHAGFDLFGPDPEQKVRRIEANPPVEQVGNIIKIGRVDDPALRRNLSIDYDLVVPAETRLSAKNGSGDVTAVGVRGPAQVSTGSGRLTLRDIGGEVRASTGSGDVELDGIGGPVRASTGSGRIRALRIGGAFDGSTGSGDIRVEQTAAGKVRVDTGSGTVELVNARGMVSVSTGSGDVRAQGEPVGDWRVETGSGSVRVELASAAGFDLDARSSSGRVSVDRPITLQGTVKRSEMRGKVGAGGHLVTVRTGSGDITVR